MKEIIRKLSNVAESDVLDLMLSMQGGGFIPVLVTGFLLIQEDAGMKPQAIQGLS